MMGVWYGWRAFWAHLRTLEWWMIAIPIAMGFCAGTVGIYFSRLHH